jgi:large subunit ribosomal protein L29
MKIGDARAMTDDEIEDKILELKKEQFNLRFQKATGQLANTARVRIVRRDIAQLMTIGREKKLGKPRPAPTAKASGAKAKAKPKTKTKAKAKAKGK